MIHLTWLLALAQTTPAGPASSPAPAADVGWNDLDRVLLIINDDILTFVQMLRPFREMAREENVRTQEGQARLWSDLYVKTIRMRVATQAGQSMGFDEALIDYHAREDFKNFVRVRGGPSEMTKWLEQRDMTAEELKKAKRDSIYAGLWEEAVTGRGASTSGRPSRDRFVRPGLLRFKHQVALATPGGLARIGGKDDEYELQLLFVDVADFDRPERAREVAMQLRSRIVDGESMDELVDQYDPGSTDHGRLPRSSRVALERTFPRIGAFLTAAKVGDVSDVLAIETTSRKGFALLRMHGRTSAEVPDLAAQEVQRKLHDAVQRELDDSRIEMAMRQAMAGSYVWEADLPKSN
jgi:hypothetical protein